MPNVRGVELMEGRPAKARDWDENPRLRAEPRMRRNLVVTTLIKHVSFSGSCGSWRIRASKRSVSDSLHRDPFLAFGISLGQYPQGRSEDLASS
jgi:hypothetical protein